MDVRCDRCQTECKLEDARVGDLGGQVQCSDCGHIIVIGHRPPVAAPASKGAATPSPDADEWLVETVHGRLLRSPDLATMHRWIIERRVTREDRVSRDGQTWQRIGDVADLVPFFDIVDSAERARRADTPGPLLLPSPPPLAAKPLSVGDQQEPDHGRLDDGAERTETKVVKSPAPRLPSPAMLALTAAVAGLVAYAGIALHNCRSRTDKAGQAAYLAVAAENAPGGEPAAAALPSPATLEAIAVPEVPEPRGPAVEPIPGEDVAPVQPLLRKRSRAPARAVAARGTRPAAARHPVSESGGAKSASPPALAAQGYVAFNRRQFPQAIALFKQALAGNPSNGTALFGLAEAYRESGQKAPALKCYRRYIQILPSGPDAGSARLQIKLLEGKKH
jgi:predicted Zn finger-like uncharacterized protein